MVNFHNFLVNILCNVYLLFLLIMLYLLFNMIYDFKEWDRSGATTMRL